MSAFPMVSGASMEDAEQEDPGLETESVRLPADLINMARFVVTQRKLRKEKAKITQYLAGLLRDQITADYHAEAIRFAEQHIPKGRKKT